MSCKRGSWATERRVRREEGKDLLSVYHVLGTITYIILQNYDSSLNVAALCYFAEEEAEDQINYITSSRLPQGPDLNPDFF